MVPYYIELVMCGLFSILIMLCILMKIFMLLWNWGCLFSVVQVELLAQGSFYRTWNSMNLTVAVSVIWEVHKNPQFLKVLIFGVSMSGNPVIVIGCGCCDMYMFNGFYSRTTWVSQHQKGKPFWILMKHDMMGWQWLHSPLHSTYRAGLSHSAKAT